MTGDAGGVSAFGAAMLGNRVLKHGNVAATSASASAMAGLVLLAGLWPAVPHAWLLVWLACLAGALALRLAVARAQRHSTRPIRDDNAWLRRHRAAFLVHGLVWAWAGGALPFFIDGEHMALLATVLCLLCAGAMLTTTFDLTAALLFVTPVALPMTVQLVSHGRTTAAQGAMLGLFILAAWVSARRSYQVEVEAMKLQFAQALHGNELRHSAEAAEGARKALADQHRLMQQLLLSTGQGFWFIDSQGVGTDLNPAMERLLGRPREQVVGRSVFEFFDGPDLSTMRREIEARGHGKTGSYEIGITRPDGSRLHCINLATPIHDAAGSRLGSVGIWTDISVRRLAETELRTYELLAQSITDLVSVVDEDGVYRLVNDAWCRTTGLTRQQAVGSRFIDALGLTPTDERQQALAACLAGNQRRVVRGTTRLPGLVGRVIETTYYPYAEQGPGMRRVVMVTRDVTEQEESRGALLASAEYLRRTLNATSEAIFASDAATAHEPVRFVNDQMLQMWGIPAGRGPGLTPATILDFARPLFADPEGEQLRINAQQAGELLDDVRVRLRDGRTLLRRCVHALVDGRDLRVWRFRDVTAEERAMQIVQASDAEQRALLDAFPGHIGRLNADLVYTYANQSLARLLGLTPEAMVGRSAAELLGEARAAELRPMAARVLTGETLTYEHQRGAADGGPAAESQVTLAPGVDPRTGAPAIYGFAIDISARRRAEAALIEARDEAERANRAKSKFLSQMSHELRTPMNAILGFGQLLESDDRQPLEGRHRRWVQQILRASEHLLELINEVLDLGRVEAGSLRLSLAALPLHELAEECLSLMRTLATSHGVRLLHLPTSLHGVQVLADRTRLRQVMLNLLANAIKYNRVGGEVELLCRREAKQVWLAVRDTGLGLTPAERLRLFQPFERLSAAQSAIEGSGIGLALSRQLMDAMNGSIGVDSEAGVGSTFWLRLPLADEATAEVDEGAAETAAPSSPQGDASAATVLYIEDNPVNVALMEAALTRLPEVRLICALMPAEGLRLARLEHPALILLDIQLPGMDGFEVLARLRASPTTRDTPVIAVSANAMPDDIAAAMAAGFDGYLTKPLGLELLLGTVRRALQRPPP